MSKSNKTETWMPSDDDLDILDRGVGEAQGEGEDPTRFETGEGCGRLAQSNGRIDIDHGHSLTTGIGGRVVLVVLDGDGGGVGVAARVSVGHAVDTGG